SVHAGEQQHRARRAQVVKHRADDEVDVRRQALCLHTVILPKPRADRPSDFDGRLACMPTNQRYTRHLADGAPLDETNRKLLHALQDDARLSRAELGRRVGLSSPAVAERLQRLESEGVITGYRTDVDPRALGYALGAVIRVRPAA